MLLRSNTTGGGNTANGMASLYSNTIGSLNTASGFQALYYNTTGYDNVAHGVSSLYPTLPDTITQLTDGARCCLILPVTELGLWFGCIALQHGR